MFRGSALTMVLVVIAGCSHNPATTIHDGGRHEESTLTGRPFQFYSGRLQTEEQGLAFARVLENYKPLSNTAAMSLHGLKRYPMSYLPRCRPAVRFTFDRRAEFSFQVTGRQLEIVVGAPRPGLQAIQWLEEKDVEVVERLLASFRLRQSDPSMGGDAPNLLLERMADGAYYWHTSSEGFKRGSIERQLCCHLLQCWNGASWQKKYLLNIVEEMTFP